MELKAGFWIRVGATLLDFIIIGLPLIVIIGVITGNPKHTSIDLIYLVYTFILPIYFNGKTFGKSICKIRIARVADFSDPTWWTMTKRILLFSILSLITFGIIWIVSIFFVIFREDKRGLHDLIAGTVVIEDLTI